MTSTLDGTYTPAVGDLVWEQLYDPQRPANDSSIRERVDAGLELGERSLMELHKITRDYDPTEYARGLGADLEPRSVTRWYLVDPGKPNEPSRMSWVEDDWCVLEPAGEDQGALF